MNEKGLKHERKTVEKSEITELKNERKGLKTQEKIY